MVHVCTRLASDSGVDTLSLLLGAVLIGVENRRLSGTFRGANGDVTPDFTRRFTRHSPVTRLKFARYSRTGGDSCHELD